MIDLEPKCKKCLLITDNFYLSTFQAVTEPVVVLNRVYMVVLNIHGGVVVLYVLCSYDVCSYITLLCTRGRLLSNPSLLLPPLLLFF